MKHSYRRKSIIQNHLLNYFKKLIYCGLLVCLTIFLAACGFHLQGKLQLAKPLQRVYLETNNPYGALTRALQLSFQMSHATLVATPEEAVTKLIIIQDVNSQTLISVNSTTQTRQYNLTVTVTFAISDKHGRLIFPPQTLTEARAITIQSNQILGSSNEANLYYQQMRNTLATAIMNRIASKDITAVINQYSYSS